MFSKYCTGVLRAQWTGGGEGGQNQASKVADERNVSVRFGSSAISLSVTSYIGLDLQQHLQPRKWSKWR